MMQLNPKLKQLISHKDFKDAAPFLFGEKFGATAKDRLEAAEYLKKTMSSDNSQQGFRKATPKEQVAGWKPVQRHRRELGMASNKAKKGQPKK